MINTELGPYRIETELGRGGMATVYRAFHHPLRRYVALKVLDPLLSRSPEFLQRFEQEATIAAQLDHPNIVTVYDLGLTNGCQYIAMRLIDGPALERVIAEGGPFAAGRALNIVAQLADALDFAHQAGVLHRDVKPSNVMLQGGDRAILADFGIARATEGLRLTVTQSVVGTPRYMSPEQAMALPLDRRSDLYSLGVVFYEMLTGRPPFQAASTPALLYKHVHDPAPPLRDLRDDLPDGLQALVERCLAKAPDDRIQTGAELAAACRRLLGDRALQATLMPDTPGRALDGRSPPATMLEPSAQPAPSRRAQPDPPAAPLPIGAQPATQEHANAGTVWQPRVDGPGTPLSQLRREQIGTEVDDSKGGLGVARTIALVVVGIALVGAFAMLAGLVPSPWSSSAAPSATVTAVRAAVVPTSPPVPALAQPAPIDSVGATPAPPTLGPPTATPLPLATPIPEPARRLIEGSAALAQRRWQAALDNTSAGLELDPTYPGLAQVAVQAHLGLADQLWREGQLAPAQVEFQQVLSPQLKDGAYLLTCPD